jgi:hypothetical protein
MSSWRADSAIRLAQFERRTVRAPAAAAADPLSSGCRLYLSRCWWLLAPELSNTPLVASQPVEQAEVLHSVHSLALRAPGGPYITT